MVDPDKLMRFQTRQSQLKGYAEKKEIWTCDFCEEEIDGWASMSSHLVEEHEDEIDFDKLDEQTDRMLEA